jgi:hypothetical protein
MKRLLLAGASLMALMAAAPTASATTTVFAYAGKIVDYIVPADGAYQIRAYGAAGGRTGGLGGKGTEVYAQFELTKDEVLQIAVGGAGQNGDGSGAGGGGGSFVIGPESQILAIAGGGAGAGSFAGIGGDGQAGLDGADGTGTNLHKGYGGAGGEAGGYGGGGFKSAGGGLAGLRRHRKA